MSGRGYTVLHVGLVQGVEKCWESGVVEDKSHPGNRKNGSLEARNENGPIYSYTTLRRGWREVMDRWIFWERTHLFIHNLEAWLERGHGQMDFYLTQVMSDHGAFNVYLFRMKLVESPKCTNCDRSGWDDNARHTLFESLAFQRYQEDVMSTLQEKSEQPLTLDNLVTIMLRSAEGWNQIVFVALTMFHKMELVWEGQRRSIASITQHPLLDLTIPRCLPFATQ